MKPIAKLGMLVAAVGSIGLSTFLWNHWTICPFKAVVSDGAPEPRLHERQISYEEKAAFVAVLSKYGEHYRQTRDAILITPRLYFDQELRWNYTTKR